MVGLGLLVSFTADAGTENAIGASRLGVIDAGTVPPLPPGTVLIGSALRRLGDEPPQAVFKTGAHVFPVVQRAGKGDPARPPAESFARRAANLREAGGALVFGDVTGSVTGVLTQGSAIWDPESEPEAAFVPVPDLGLTTGSGTFKLES